MMGQKQDEILEALEAQGWMLMAGPETWTLTSRVSGDAIRGSWWGHDSGHAIYDIAMRLEEHPDVETFRLLDRKVTFVHRRLWPAILAAGQERAAWQTGDLRPEDRAVLEEVEAAGKLTAHRSTVGGLKGRPLGNVVLRLETRLLMHATQEHTDEGAHSKMLESWAHWAERRRVDPGALSPDRGRELIAEAMRAAVTGIELAGRLPWLPGRRKK